MFNLALSRPPAIRAIAGTQDNGTNRYDGGLVWSNLLGGDGGAVAIDPNDADRLYGSGDNAGTVLQSSDAGLSWVDFFSNIPKTTRARCHAWEMTFQLQVLPTTPATLLDACVSLWRTTDTAPVFWHEILTPPTGQSVVRFSVDPSTGFYYAGTDAGVLFAGLGGADWQQVFQHPASTKVSDIEVDGKDPQTIYVSFAPRVVIDRGCDRADQRRIYRWRRSSPNPPADITAKLPPGLCVNALAVDPHIPRTVYAATTRGVYHGRGNATGESWVWTLYDNGMPPADVRDLAVDPVAGQIYAATFGRGALKVTPETILPVSIDIKPDSSANIINVKSGGKIPVAILSSITFDAPNEVSRDSLRFGRTGTEASLASCSADAQDVNGDQLPDLVCHFHTALTGFQVGDTLGFLKGFTREGVPIAGSDAVKILNQ
jgi:hypothetical protein